MSRLLYRANMLDRLATQPVPIEGCDDLFVSQGNDIGRDWADEDEAFEAMVCSLHSSFRNDTGETGLVARLVPTWRESLEQMRQVQNITGDLPAVLYPNFQDSEVVYDAKNAPFATRTFQPKASEWCAMGLEEDASIGEIKAVMAARGFDGITYDALHCQGFRHPLDLASRLASAGLIRSVHLSLNRLDITGFRSELAASTRYARKAFIESEVAASQTLEGQIVLEIVRNWRQLGLTDGQRFIVLEDGPLKLGRTKRDQAAIIEHARELVA